MCRRCLASLLALSLILCCAPLYSKAFAQEGQEVWVVLAPVGDFHVPRGRFSVRPAILNRGEVAIVGRDNGYAAQKAGLAIVVATCTVAKPWAYVVSRSGVVTNTPWRATWTWSWTSRCTCR